MAHQPLLRPDPPRGPQPVSGPASPINSKPAWVEDAAGDYLAELAATLASHGGGDASTDLALDLVLNEIVEQTRLSVSAAGAAIALLHDDEMICRATAGECAPDLGVRLNTRAGLIGYCVQTKELQRCDDTQTDSRVDAAAYRLLEVRSLLVLPIMDGKELLGIFEVFSPRLQAFGETEIQIVQGLSQRIVDNIRRAAATSASAAAAETTSQVEPAANTIPPEPEPEPETDAWPWEVEAAKPEPDLSFPPETVPKFPEPPKFEFVEPEKRKWNSGRDYWTSVLTAVVIALALFLGWMVGRAGWEMALKRVDQPTQIVEPPQPAAPASSEPATPPAPSPKKTAAPAPAVRAAKATSAGASKSSTRAKSATPTDEAPAGSLVVYENGKVVFQMKPPPQASPAATEPADAGSTGKAGAGAADSPAAPEQVPSETAAGYVTQRVEPQYPDAAKQQNIQGSVVLNTLVGSDGVVKEVSVVSGDALLATAASDAVRQWRFKPYRSHGRPVEFETRVTVNFTLP